MTGEGQISAPVPAGRVIQRIVGQEDIVAVLIRRPQDFSVAEQGERGLIELLSLLPTSYPGHILLTEDEGEILGEDDCSCGRKGKYFKIYGRMKGAEIRGCSDTYERR